MIASLLLALYLMGGIDTDSVVALLFISGALLIGAEIFLGTFGFAAVNGFVAIYVGNSIKSGEVMFLGLGIDWGLFFGIAAFELFLVAAMFGAYIRQRGKPATTGPESMIGKMARIEEWYGTTGRVIIHGESWKAQCPIPQELSKKDKVKIESVGDLILTIEPIYEEKDH
jgi:membrane-bound serine protease (ClpP class)